jgi:hypothetical protein
MIPQLLAAASVATSLFGGFSAKEAADDSASLQKQEGKLKRDELFREAARIRDEGFRFKQEQMIQYVSSGVEITGTPLLLMQETSIMAEAEAKATEDRGTAIQDLANANAKITKKQGKAALISSIGNAVSGGVNTYRAAKG